MKKWIDEYVTQDEYKEQDKPVKPVKPVKPFYINEEASDDFINNYYKLMHDFYITYKVKIKTRDRYAIHKSNVGKDPVQRDRFAETMEELTIKYKEQANYIDAYHSRVVNKDLTPTSGIVITNQVTKQVINNVTQVTKPNILVDTSNSNVTDLIKVKEVKLNRGLRRAEKHAKKHAKKLEEKAAKKKQMVVMQ